MRHASMTRFYLLLSLLLAGLFVTQTQAFAVEIAPDGTTSVAAPTIQSDKADYPPGGTVILTGGNWQPGESVHINVNDDQGNTWSRNVDVVADATGNIRDEFQLPDHFVATYKVTATGAQSGVATTSFTDGNVGIRNASDTPSELTASYKLEGFNSTDCTGTAIANRSTTFSITGPGLGTTPEGQAKVASGNNQSVKVSFTTVTPNTYEFKQWNFFDGNTVSNGTFFDTDGPGGTNDRQTSFCLQTQNSTNKTFVGLFKSKNQAPVASNDSYEVNEDGTLNIAAPGVLSNDTDADGNKLVVKDANSSVAGVQPQSGPSNGTLTLNADGSFTYTPNNNFNGSDSFTYMANDGTIDSNLATVSITINPVNDAPTVSNIADQTILEDASTGDLAFTVSDVDNADSALTVSGSSSDTTLVPNANITFGGLGGSRTVKATPAANRFGGPATITVTVSDGDKSATDTFDVSVTPVNDAPSFTKGADQTVDEDAGAQTVSPFATNISAGPFETQNVSFDTTNDNNALFTSGGQPSVASGGALTYTPAANASGTATVTVTAKDSGGTANGGVDTSAPQTFTITVRAVNDAPTADSQSVSTNEDTPLDITLGASDVDSSNLTYSVVTGPAHGGLSGTGANLTYTPDADYNGADSFTFKASDGALDSNVATVSITVNAVNDAPVAVDDRYSTNEDTDLVVSAADGLLKNDTDVENNPLRVDDGDASAAGINPVTGPTHGTVTLAADGSFTYKPNADYNGSDSFDYRVCDNGSPQKCSVRTANVSITINAVNDAPVNAVPAGEQAVDEDGVLTFNGPNNNAISVSDVDAGNGPLKVTLGVEHGKLILGVTVGITFAAGSNDNAASMTFSGTISDVNAALGGLRYAPNGNYNGADTLTIVTNDQGNTGSGPAEGLGDTDAVKVNVRAINDAPEAKDDSKTTDEDTAVVVDVVANDTDIDNPAADLRVVEASISDPANGTAALIATGPDAGKIRYTPDLNYNNNGGASADTFTYKVSDGAAASASPATVSITVDPVNDAPTVGNITGAALADEGDSKDYSVTATDVDGDALTYVWTVKTGAATVTGGATTKTATVKFLDGPDNVNLQIVVDDGKMGGQVTRNLDGSTVSVSNVAPTTTLSANNTLTADEGQTKTYTYTVTDPGDDTYTAAEACGANGNKTDTQAANSFDCTFPDGPASSTVGVSATDSDNAKGNTASQTVEIYNVAPTVTLAALNSLTVNEGSEHTYSYSISDPGADTVSSVSTSCGINGTKVAVSDSNTDTSGSFKCRFPDGPASSTVSAQATDSDNATGNKAEQTVQVANVKPTVVLSGAATADEGQTKTYTYTVTDPGDDTYTAAEACGANGNKTDTQAANSFDCTFPDGPALTDVTVKVTDSDGAADTDNQTVTVTVSNVAPTATFNRPTQVDEGTAINLSLTEPTDPGSADTAFEYAFDCNLDDATGYGVFSGAPGANAESCPTNDNGTRNVGAKIRDKDGGVTEYTAAVTIVNVAPTARLVAPLEVNEGSNIAISLADKADPGSADTFEYAFDCDLDDATGYGAFGAQDSASCSTNDDGTRRVGAKIRDDDGGVSEYTASVKINNVAPSVTAAADQSSNEGEDKLFNLGSFTDPGDDGPWQVTVDWGDGSQNTAFSAGTGTLPQKPHAYADNGTYTVTVKVAEAGEGATPSDQKTFSVTVANVKPSINLTGAATADEDQTKTYSYTVRDPGARDTHTTTTSCGTNGVKVQDSDVYSAATREGSFKCRFPNGPATTDVTAKATDNGGLSDTDNQKVVVDVANVAPSVTAPANQTSNEGQTKAFDLGSFADPGPDGPWQVTVDWGDNSAPTTFSADVPGALAQKQHAYTNNGLYTVTVKVAEAGLGETPSGSKTFTVTVDNVAPTAKFNTPAAAVDEGSPFQLSLSDKVDPGSNDTFEYAFNCGNGYGTFGPSDSATCPTDDNGTRNVGAKIRDKDGGVTEYTGSVTVRNVAPTVTGIAASSQNVLASTAVSPNSVTFTGTATDPSSVDTSSGFYWQWALGTGAYGPWGAINANTYKTSFASCGAQTVSAIAKDKDGGVSAPFTTNYRVNAYDGAYKAPLVDGTVNKVQKGQVVPVKISIGCGTTNLTGLAPNIQLLTGNQTPEADANSTAVTTSVSSADTGQTMRPVDGGYIYNLRVPSDSTATVGKQYTIRVNPFGADANHAATGMYIVLEIRK